MMVMSYLSEKKVQSFCVDFLTKWRKHQNVRSKTERKVEVVKIFSLMMEDNTTNKGFYDFLSEMGRDSNTWHIYATKECLQLRDKYFSDIMNKKNIYLHLPG